MISSLSLKETWGRTDFRVFLFGCEDLGFWWVFCDFCCDDLILCDDFCCFELFCEGIGREPLVFPLILGFWSVGDGDDENDDEHDEHDEEPELENDDVEPEKDDEPENDEPDEPDEPEYETDDPDPENEG